MTDLSESLLRGISKKLDKLIELVKDLIRILGNRLKKEWNLHEERKKWKMENIWLDKLWVLLAAVFSWIANRLTGKIDDLEKNKATNSSLGRVADHARALDKKIDELSHTALPRVEVQQAHEKIHERLNSMERNKSDRIKNVRVHHKDQNGES